MLNNPYNLDRDDSVNCRRVSGYVSTAHYNLIKCMRPGPGTINHTITNLWQKVCSRIQELGITDVTKVNEYESFISDCVILSRDEYETLLSKRTFADGRRLSDLPVGGTMSETFQRDGYSGEKGLVDSDTTTPSKSTNLQSGGGEGRGNENEKGKKGTKNKGNC